MNMRKGFKTGLLCALAAAVGLSWGCAKAEPEATEAPTTVPEQTAPAEPADPMGYVSAAPYAEGYVACGTGGRMDSISVDGVVTSMDTGTTEDLHCVYANGDDVVACGNGGTVIRSTDGGKTFSAIGPDSDSTIFSVTMHNDTLYAAAEGGVLYRLNDGDWETIRTETKHDLVSVVSTSHGVAAISAETDVCFLQDGEEWQFENFNEVFDGLYPAYTFTKLVSGGESFFVLGHEVDNPAYPLVMYTTFTDMNGDVWMQKEMMKLDGEYVSPEMEIPLNDICFCADQIVGAMDGGKALALTECVECNETKTVEGAGDLWAAASRDDSVLLCGEDFFVQVMESKQIRQDKIKAEQARDDIVFGGALLIDVREADELASEGYIQGSIHVPLAEVESRLPEISPDLDREIIFYCASGKRSQKATELAVDMGYTKVYNLGGLSDWPYEIVKD